MHKFLKDYPDSVFEGNAHVSGSKPQTAKFDMATYRKYLQMDESVPPVDWAKPGTQHAMQQFDSFLKNGLKHFDELRNNPNYKEALSNMSPWINHGHVSFQTLARQVKKLNKYANGTAAYIEEGLVRRELSDNFVFYAPDDYDSLGSAAEWARESLELHTADQREWLYSLEELETAKTHDDLWNAAQLQLVQEGKLHGFVSIFCASSSDDTKSCKSNTLLFLLCLPQLRMYWAKKILEWTESPNVALRTAQYFNDKYALDGNDPNGFTGVGWSIMGIHDMGWKERPIFGKIRYMNYAGCKRKFDVAEFAARYKGAYENAIAAGEKYGKEPDVATKKKKATAKKPAAKKKQKT
jgi:deoxyribodipyrimidine photo-lyase